MITVAALVLAGVGTASVLGYVRRADDRALAGMKAVSALVAQKTIPAGTAAGAALRQGLLASQQMPASAVPSDAVRAITTDLSSLVLNATLQPGQLLLRPALAAAAKVTSGLAIPPGMMAVTARFCAPEAVAGAVQPDSQVAVFDTVVSGGSGQVTAQPACDGPHQQPAGAGVKTRVVLSRVRVLSVGGSPPAAQASPSLGASGASASGQGTMLLTLAVTQAAAEKLIQITETGLPYLALVTTSSRIKADIGHLLDNPPSPSPTPTVTQSSQGPSQMVITQPSDSPVPVIITLPTTTLPTTTPSTTAPGPTPTPTQSGHQTPAPCSGGGHADAYTRGTRSQC